MSLRYQLDVADCHAHLFRVRMSIDRPAETQVLSLPAWIPGSYLIREFARHVSHLEAYQGSQRLALLQRDKSSWIIHAKGTKTLTVSYLVYAFDPSVRAAWLDASRGFVNGTSVFLRLEGREHERHVLLLGQGQDWPKTWRIATTLPGIQINEQGQGRYEAPDYDALVDHPIEMGDFWHGHFTAAGVPHEFTVTGALPHFDSGRLLADTRRICETQIAFWHGGADAPPPFSRYIFMLNAMEEGYGGLEHRTSTALIANRRDLPHHDHRELTDGYVTLLGLISHEYFHTWNVKRLRPIEFSQYDYTRENHTELLWFFEGFTSYYDDLFLVRSHLIDAHRYLKLLSKTITQVQSTPGRFVQNLAQASFDAWIKYYRPDENTLNATVSYYTKGALLALALDLTLRLEGASNLDELMRALWSRSQGGPISEDDICAALTELGQHACADQLKQWVHGTEDLPLKELLDQHGVDWDTEAATPQQLLGAKVHDSAGGLKIQSICRGGLAEQCGLSVGDEILAFENWRVRKLDDLMLLGAFKQRGSLLVVRDQHLRSLDLRAPQAITTGNVCLRWSPKPGTAARNRRAQWLTG